MKAIARAGINFQMRKMFAHHRGGLERAFDIINREDKNLGFVSTRSAQQIQPRGIAVMHPITKTANEVDLLEA